MSRTLRTIVPLTLALAGIAAGARADEPAGMCTWGGVPTQETGIARVHPALSNATPAGQPIHLDATGELAGSGCPSSMTFEGTIIPGAQCRLFFEYGRVIGVPGVAWFFGQGSAYGRGFLYGADGKLVGTYDPQVITQVPEVTPKCLTPEGISEVRFSATVQLLPRAS